MHKHADPEVSWAKDEYLVALKLIVRDGDNILIMKDAFGNWDIPGGRIRRDQFGTPYEIILREKIDVELGTGFQYELNGIKTLMRVERKEHGRDGQRVRIFAVGYEAFYESGEVELASYLESYEWINIKTTNLDEYADNSGWVDKLKDYQQVLLNESNND